MVVLVVGGSPLSCSKLTWQMDLVKMYLLLKMVIFHCYVSLPEGNSLLMGKMVDEKF